MTTCFHVSALPAVLCPSTADKPSAKKEEYQVRSGDVMYQHSKRQKLAQSINKHNRVAASTSDMYSHVVYGVARDTLGNADRCTDKANLTSCGILQATRTGVLNINCAEDNYKMLTEGHTPKEGALIYRNISLHRLRVGDILHAMPHPANYLVTERHCNNNLQPDPIVLLARNAFHKNRPQQLWASRIGHVLGWDDRTNSIRVKLAPSPPVNLHDRSFAPLVHCLLPTITCLTTPLS